MKELKESSTRLKPTSKVKAKELTSLYKQLNRQEAIIKKISFDLGERKKELRCQNQITKLLNNSRLSPEMIFQNITNLLPPAFQYPEKASARIIVSNNEYITKGFKRTKTALTKIIKAGSKIIGKIEVCYNLKKGEKVNKIFLKEESDLLNLISQRIIAYYENNQKEILLIEKEKSFRKLVENINEIIYEISSNGKIKYISPKIHDLLGYKPEELIGKKSVSFVYKEDKKRISELLRNITVSNYEAFEFRFIHKNGENRWVRTTIRPLFENGILIGGTGAIYDITNNKLLEESLLESERLHRSIFEASPDLITITDLNGIIISTSPKASELFDNKKNESFVGRNILDFIHPEYRKKAKSEIEKMFSGEFQGADEYLALKQDGSPFYIEVSGQFINDENGRPKQMIFITRDINVRKELERKLHSTEELFKSLVESVNDVIYEVSSDGTINYVSPAIKKILGFTPEELIGKNFFYYMHPEDRPNLIKALKELGKKDYSYLEYRYFTKEGKTRWVRSSTAPVIENGVLVGGRGSLTDIHEKKLTELALIENEENYRSLFYNSPEGYLLIKDGVFVDCNKASENIIGGDRSMIIGKTPNTLSPEFQPNGKRSADYSKELIEETFLSGKKSFEWVHTKFDGSEFIAQINLSVIEQSGEKIILAMWQDITSRRKNEEALRKLSLAVEQSPVSIIITNLNGNIEYANPMVCKTTGYSLEELLGRNPRVLKSGETSQDEYKRLWNNISEGYEWKGVFHNKRKNGEYYWESASIAPITDVSGKITHYLAIKEDITERKLFENALAISEMRFRQVAGHSRSVIWEVNMDGLYKFVSDVSEKLYGYLPEELVGKKHFYDIHPLKGQEQFKKLALAAIARGDEILNFDNPIIRSNGEQIWVSTNGAPIIDSKNNKIGFRGLDIDITARKLTEQELTTFRTISDKANYGIAISDLNGILIYSNDTFAKMHGYEINDLIGNNLSMLHSEKQIVRLNKTLELLKKNGEFSAEEVWRTRKDGTIFPSLMNAKVLKDENNVPQFMWATTIDITELKESADALTRSEEKLNYAQEIAQMGSWELNLKTKELSWSKNYFKLLEQNENQNPSTELFNSLIYPDDFHLIEEYQFELIKTKKPISFNMRLIMPNGRTKWVKNNIVPHFENDNLISLSGVNIDITYQKEYEQEIKKLNIAIEQSPIAILITDLNANIQYVSPAFYKMTGYISGEVIGQSTKILKSGKTSISVYEELWETSKSRKTWSGEWINKKKDGELYWEAVSISPISDLNNNVINYLAIKENITQRKNYEKEILELNENLEKKVIERTEELARSNEELQKKTNELETFFTVALDLLCIADTDGNFLKVNKSWEDILGYTRDELMSKKFLEFVHPEDVQSTLEAMQELSDQKPIFKFTNRYKSISGEYKYIEWHSVPVGNLIYAAARDITNWKNYEEELTKARLAAESANQSKSEFLSRMSHELRTPMNSILGFAQLMQMGQLNPSQEKGVKHILKSGRHLLGLINEILDISRIEAGRISISIEPVEIKGLINEVIDTVVPIANVKNIKIELDENFKELYVKSDKQRLKQVLINLINNAIKYNKEGGNVWIIADVLTNNPSGVETVRIMIKDNGFGISENNIPKLFTPFERIGAEASSTEGTGLGLTVVKKLVELMGGIVGVESKLSEGSVFWIELQKTVNDLEKYKKIQEKDNTNQNIKANIGRILYIEDNISNIELIEQILTTSRPKIELITTMYGAQAEKLAEEHKPGLILLDINLPDINGSEVLKILKANMRTEKIPVVIISADAMQKQLDDMIKAGAQNYITKPIDVEEFLKIVDKVIE